MFDLAPVLGALVVILVAARMGGALAQRLGQPPVLGELLAGVLLGNLGLLGWHGMSVMRESAPLELLSQLGVLFLLFTVGLESDVKRMAAVGSSAFLVAVIGVIVPMLLGATLTAWWYPQHPRLADWFVGATLAATSVGITARVLSDLGRADTLEGRIILGAAVIDDVLGLIVLAVVAGLIDAANAGRPFDAREVLLIVGKSVAFLGGALLVGRGLSKRVFHIARNVPGDGLLLTIALAFCFGLSYLAILSGLAGIVGAFAAGLILDELHYRELRDRDRRKRDLAELLQPLTTFLVPVFFVLMGMRVDLATFAQPGVVGFAVLLTLAAVIGKQACSLAVVTPGADRIAVGLGMIPRGEVGLIFAGIGSGLMIAGERVVDGSMFAAVIVMVAVTTLVTPPLLVARLQKVSLRTAKAAAKRAGVAALVVAAGLALGGAAGAQDAPGMAAADSSATPASVPRDSVAIAASDSTTSPHAAADSSVVSDTTEAHLAAADSAAAHMAAPTTRAEFERMIDRLARLQAARIDTLTRSDSSYSIEAFGLAERLRRLGAGPDTGAVPTPAAAQARVGPEDAWLIYSVGDSSTSLWMIRARGWKHVMLPPRAALRDRVDGLLRGLADANASDAPATVQHARALYLALVGSVEMELGGIDRLVVVPDDLIARVPFETLVLRPVGGEAERNALRGGWLIEHAEVAYAPNVRYLLAAPLPLAPGTDVVGVGPSASPELKALGAHSKGRLRRATRETLPGMLAQASVVHVAATPPGDSSAMLAVRDLAALPVLRVELVTVSEAGDRAREGLGQTMLSAGARRVLAAEWRVEPEDAADLLGVFYDQLLDQKRGATHALAEAKRRMLMSGSTSAPYHWASYVLVGAPEPMVVPKTTKKSGRR